MPMGPAHDHESMSDDLTVQGKEKMLTQKRMTTKRSRQTHIQEWLIKTTEKDPEGSTTEADVTECAQPARSNDAPQSTSQAPSQRNCPKRKHRDSQDPTSSAWQGRLRSRSASVPATECREANF